MKKTFSLVALLAAATLLTACSKTPDADTEAPAAAAQAEPAAEPPAAREATYDPNLKPAEIVWDSPEKKAQWEARQAQLRAAPAQQAQPAAAPAAR